MKINGHSCGSIFTDKKPTLAVRWLSFQAPASLLRRNAIVFRWSPRPGAFRAIEKSFFLRTQNKGICDRFLPHFPVSHKDMRRKCGERAPTTPFSPTMLFSHCARCVLPVVGFDVMKNYSRVLSECVFFSKNSEIFPGSFALSSPTRPHAHNKRLRKTI